jgi:hypothetical protein
MDPHLFEEDLGSIFHCDSLLASYDNGHIRKLINHYNYTIIVVLGGRKDKHVIHRDGFPRRLGSRKRGVQSLLLDGWLGNGTCSARYNILGEFLSKFGQ